MSVILRVGAVKSSGGQELHYGSGDEASSSYTDADVLDIPLPEHTYQRPLPPSSTQSLNSCGYFGLPYQDHNYGMPPPPSPPRPASPRPPSPLQVNGVVQMEEEVKTTPLVSVAEEVVEDSVTRCICGYLHDDGYMICCDKCSVWQHIDCMGVDRNNIPDSYFCELCQPRILDAIKAKALQKRKREELAARNVLSDSSATDTDPEEAANAMASMGRKLPIGKKKGLKHKRNTKVKDKPSIKLKIGKALAQKNVKKPGKKEKENIKGPKPKKMFKQNQQKLKLVKMKNRPLLTLEQLNADPWNSNLSPWIDSYEHAHENQYSQAVKEFSCNSHLIGQSVDISSIMPDHMLSQLTCVAISDVKKNRKGLKATQEIPAGQVIIEYKGKVMLRHDYDREYSFVNSFKKLQPFVLFYSKLDVDLCVDARTFGNEARFIRRSCTPNSEVKHIFTQGKVYFVVVSQKDINVGSEITIPFDYNFQECSYCVECACIKNNCVVSRFWKKVKNAQRSSSKEFTVKRKKLLSGEVDANALYDAPNSSSSQASPSRVLSSPVKALQMKLAAAVSPPPRLSSPIKLSNVSTLLAASALLDEQPDIACSLKLEVPDSLHQAPPPPAPPPPIPKSATSSRRASRVSEEIVKEEKVEAVVHTHTKEKHLKVKEPKIKDKDKESKDHYHHHPEIKKERRPSSRRQSQDELEDIADHKGEASTAPPGNESEDSNTGYECPRKMTREERKLDAIMKAFEKMEKREERRKEALARVDTVTKKCSDIKPKKENDGNGSNGSNVHSRSASQDAPVDVDVKVETSVDDHHEIKSPEISTETKPESPAVGTPPVSGGNTMSYFSSVTSVALPEIHKAVKEELTHKPMRKTGKRKRRRSRIQSTAATSDAASVSTDEGNSNSSFPLALMPVPPTPASAPVNTTLPSLDNEGGVFKFIKTKKHLFDEWSNKQEDESNKHEEEMFVQCLPNPHVNTMDHLQRRNSSSAGCNSKGSETSAGSAKKRWLRQAMHEVPAPIAFHHSLSVSTDSGGASPIHGGSSPNPGTALGSPGAASPLDFVTPLKKRRLMRESLSIESNGPMPSPGAGVLAENFTSNNIGITSKTNGVKQIFPTHRHSVDDRLLLHKGYPHQNGIREAGAPTEGKNPSPASATSNSRFTIASPEYNHLEQRNRNQDQGLEPVPHPLLDTLPVTVPLPWVNGISETVPLSSSSSAPFTQPSVKFPPKFRGIFERMEVDSSDGTEREMNPVASTSRVEGNGLHFLYNGLEEDNRIDSSASTSTVVVVNSSSVYKGVNNLIDEGSEAGCVTAKTIMDVDSPATVRIDLNAHEMPTSLTESTAVVNLNDRFFCRNSQDMLLFSNAGECQVNSSEDVVETSPLVRAGHTSEICDNICTDSVSAQLSGLRERDSQRTFNENHLEEEAEAVDSSQHVNRNSLDGEQKPPNSSLAQDLPLMSTCMRLDAECISSSGQTVSALTDSALDESNPVCDSLNESEQGIVESGDVSRQCDSNSVHMEDNGVQEDDSTDNEEIRTCDSMGVNSAFSHLSNSSAYDGHEAEEELGDTAVSESHCLDHQSFFANIVDNNVDSTSSEVQRGGQKAAFQSSTTVEAEAGEAAATDGGCCDSNYERLPGENSITLDESSTEGQGVSSSNGIDSQTGNTSSWELYRRRKDLHMEAFPDNAVSTETHDYISGISQSTSSAHEGTDLPAAQEQMDVSLEARPSSSVYTGLNTPPTSNTLTASNQALIGSQAPRSFTMSPPSSSHLSSSSSSSSLSVEGALSSTSPNASTIAQQANLAPSSNSTSINGSSPISSTAEATPAAKKKVSLLEYRKRLKEKPASSCTETKSSESTGLSPSSTLTHHHKLSSTLTQFLASSSPPASSTSPSKSSSSQSQKKQRMPTLATLPLFQSADLKKDEKKKAKPKPEKQLSLTERLRLEFGLEDCGDEQNKKRKAEEAEVASSIETVDDSVPPPPPPPPPTLSSAYPQTSSAAFLVASSTHPRAGFHTVQPTTLVNGVSGTNYNYHQQSNISSTSLSTPPPGTSQQTLRDRDALSYPAPSLLTGSLSSHTVPYLQQPSLSSSHLNVQHPLTWTASQGSIAAPQPQTSTNHHSPYEFNHHRQLAQSQTVVSGSTVSEDPPPPPPPRPHHRPSSTSSSQRHGHIQSSSGKSSKAAASSSSSHYPDNRSKY
ncbi:unnamed protein product [Lymnaea stagnalis]|uniref:SET domain-containing protein n=1 Tax=Lymnaea stagnalis TaxID=6523 RepID=A0AAV2IGA1_LYMST